MFTKTLRVALTVFLLGSLTASGSDAGEGQAGGEEIEREEDMDLMLKFMEEGQKKEDLSRQKVVTYQPDIPVEIDWCVREDLNARTGKGDAKVLAVVRDPSVKWAMAVSKADGKLYYTSMEKPRDNIKLLGSFDRAEEAAGMVDEPGGRAGLMAALLGSYDEKTAITKAGVTSKEKD